MRSVPATRPARATQEWNFVPRAHFPERPLQNRSDPGPRPAWPITERLGRGLCQGAGIRGMTVLPANRKPVKETSPIRLPNRKGAATAKVPALDVGSGGRGLETLGLK